MKATNLRIFRRMIEYINKEEKEMPLLISVSLHKYFNRINENISLNVRDWILDWIRFTKKDHTHILSRLELLENGSADSLIKYCELENTRKHYYMSIKDVDRVHFCSSCNKKRIFTTDMSYKYSRTKGSLCNTCGAIKSNQKKLDKARYSIDKDRNSFICYQCGIEIFLKISNGDHENALIKNTLCDTCTEKNIQNVNYRYMIPTVKCNSCKTDSYFNSYAKAITHMKKFGELCSPCFIKRRKRKNYK